MTRLARSVRWIGCLVLLGVESDRPDRLVVVPGSRVATHDVVPGTNRFAL
jgi:hypothetical protein